MVDFIDEEEGKGGYLGNPLLKKPGEKIEWTIELMQEYQKCMKDPIYFAEKYMKIVHVDKGVIPIKLYDYQKEILEAITFNRRVVANTSRQAGKCCFKKTKIKVKNKKNGNIEEIEIEDFYKKFKS